MLSCLLLLLAPLAHAIQPLATGKGNFEFRDAAIGADKPVTVWYYKPASLNLDSRVLFVMHGVKRNGEDYRDHWVRYAEKYSVLLIAPEFSERAFPKNKYQFGNVADPDVNRWSFQVIEHLFDDVKAGESLSAQKYYLYGHSAGAQFVHRYMLFMLAPRVQLAIAANAGTYTMPAYPTGYQPGFPWSVSKGLVPEERLRAVLARPLVVMLGEDDTDPYDEKLSRSPQAKAQGAHRVERGMTFYQAAQKQAEAFDMPLAWKLVTVPGVAHSNSGMARAAVKVMFEN